MNDSVLWAVAIGTGAFGLLLLAIAGTVAVFWNTLARKPQRAASTNKSPSHAGDIAAAEKKRATADSSTAQSTTIPSPWLWIKAWLFAVLHAGTVSVVLGAITFFEDLAKASEEIQSAGTVTFPKQLLPGTLSGPASRKRLSQPSGDPASPKTKENAEGEKLDQPGADTPDMSGWEVVDLVNEASTGK